MRCTYEIVFHREPSKYIVQQLQRVQPRLESTCIHEGFQVRGFDALGGEHSLLLDEARRRRFHALHRDRTQGPQAVQLGIVLLDKLGQHAGAQQAVRVEVVQQRSEDAEEVLHVLRAQRAFALDRPHEHRAQGTQPTCFDKVATRCTT